MLATSKPKSCQFTLKPLEAVCFGGRDDALDELARQVFDNHPPAVRLVGPRKIGRTAFLKFAAMDLKKRIAERARFTRKEMNLVIAYLDCDARFQYRSIREGIARSLAEAMKVDLSEFGDDFESSVTIAKLVRRMNERPKTRYLLLADRAEQMLADDRSSPQDRDWASRADTTLGYLNESVTNRGADFGVVLSFGVGGPFSNLDAKAREARERQFFEVSKMLDRMTERIELRFLTKREVEQSAGEAWVELPDGSFAHLAKDQIDWIVAVAGGHPYVLQAAGELLAFEYRERAAAPDLAQLEGTLVQTLEFFIGETLGRLGTCRSELVAILKSSEAEKIVGVSSELGDVLVGEGFAEDVSASRNGSRVKIPSRVLRGALLNRLTTASADETPMQQAPPRAAGTEPFRLAIETAGGIVPVLEITELEARLMKELVKGSLTGKLVTSKSLANLLPRERFDRDDEPKQRTAKRNRHLKQRLSVLRRKIQKVAEVGDDPIRNVYNKGYHVMKPERFRFGGI
jgi:hypothetical protein